MEANKISFTETPIIFQYNKRDLNEILPVDILNKDLNPDYKLFFTTGAISGENIIEGLKAIIEMVIPYLIDHVKHKMILQEESYNSLTPGGKIENKFEKFLLPLSKFDINNGFNDEDEEKSNNNDSQKKNEIFDLNGEEEGEIANEQTALNKDEEIFALMETKPSSLI